jgi:hypothetical protein
MPGRGYGESPLFMKIPLVLLSFFLMIAAIFPTKIWAATQDGPDNFPPVKLRAYGTLSGARLTIPGQPQASILRITAESAPKAQLVLAKYLSDLGLLPGVTPLPLVTARGPLAARQIEGQGTAAAIRSGVKVYIFTAADGASLKSLFEAHIPATMKVDATEAEIPVPMYVDRWDKNGFRFYYGPFVKPDGVKTYDPRQDFTFAKESGNVGLVVWNSTSGQPSADGILNFNSCDWVFKAGKELKLPMGVNLGIGDGIPTLANRYPEDMTSFSPEYMGGWYGAINFGIGSTVAWSSDAVQDVALGQLQPLVRQLNSEDTIVNWLEPHEEMCHGVTDVLDDHGPNARLNFIRFLQEKYQTPEAVADHWHQAAPFHTWDDVPFPEFATFLGWNSNSMDLTGMWKMSYDAPYGIDSAQPDLDESKWQDVEAPGNAVVRALPRKPAVFRRHVQIDPNWRVRHQHTWLYEFDLNDTRGSGLTSDVLVFVNGQAIPENPPFKTESHWGMLDITPALVDGDNVITVCLPQALFDYRVYLSGDAPGTYPALGPRLNAMWADFSDWTEWSRGESVRRGMQMIRQVDPDRPITLMSPDAYMGAIKEAAEDYGGVFHDTGGMAGSWGDMHPVMVQSTGLASDCEPGSGAVDLDDFKRFMGRWSTEGTNGIDYFQHIGDIEWKPAVKDYFTKTLPMWHLIGKYHVPQAELAIVNSERNIRLLGFPWNSVQVNPDLAQGTRFWGLISQMVAQYPRGGVLEQDFARGKADKFRVILDGGTSVMDPETVDAIAKWVQQGGTFITFQQTGRHTSAEQDTWPISKLTGYDVTNIDKMAPNGDVITPRTLHLVAGQPVFHDDTHDWMYAQHGGGLSLKKIDPACQDLLQWDDGSIAAGLRKLGKGMVIDLGSNSGVLPGQVLEWLKVKRVPIESSERDIMTRHFVSNNGLYDIWVMWNTKGEPLTATFTFRDGFKPASCTEVNNGAVIPIDSGDQGAKLSNLAFGAWETRAFLSPRQNLAEAAADWFALQRGWWSGTADPGKPIPLFKSKLSLDLTDDWAFKVLDGPGTDVPPEDLSLADPKLNDSTWPRVRIGIYNVPDHNDAHHVLFRKTFVVPKEWNHGRVLMFTHSDVMGGWRRYIDGKPLQVHLTDDDLGGILKPGSKHTMAVEMWSTDIPAGTPSPIYLSYRPDPVSRQEIKEWAYAPDRLTYQPTAPLPFTTSAAGAVRAMVKVDSKEASRNIVIHFGAGIDGLIVNGHWLGGNGNIYNYVDLNLTPWIKFDQENELIAVFHDKSTIANTALEFYAKGVYP